MADRIGAGFNIMLRGFFDSSGNFLGGTTTAPTAGVVAGSPMLRLQGGRTLPVQALEPDVVPADGDDQTLVTFEFDPAGLPNGVFEMAVRDDVFEALVQGTKVWESGNIRVGVYEPGDRASEPTAFLLTRRAKSWTAGERGVKKFQHLFIPQSSVKPLGNTYEQRTFNGYGYAINLSKADRLAWTTVNNTEHGTTTGAMFPIESDNPLMIQRWTGDNVTVAYTMTKTLATGGTQVVFVNDVQQANPGNWTSAGTTLTFGVAPAAAARIVSVYEYPEADIT